MKNVLNILYGLMVVAFFVGLAWLKFQVWRIAHPQAPTWTFFFGV